jgi:hypothetical protein
MRKSLCSRLAKCHVCKKIIVVTARDNLWPHNSGQGVKCVASGMPVRTQPFIDASRIVCRPA